MLETISTSVYSAACIFVLVFLRQIDDYKYHEYYEYCNFIMRHRLSKTLTKHFKEILSH